MSINPQLTYEQRCQIYALIKSDFSQRKIAEIINVNQSTISRELKRNTGERGYRYKQAQILTDNRRKNACKPTKMTKELILTIETKIRLDWSPEQISNWLLKDEATLISHESIYIHIWKDKRAGGDLYTHLRRVGKKYDKRRNGKSTRGHIKNRISIDDRPSIVDLKSRVGDWEIDTIIGKGHSGALVTIVERKTKFTVAAQVKSKSTKDVTAATIRLLEPYKDLVHTITADNGKEFSGHEEISKALNAEIYFAHPYSSWERGLNENTNGLIRQYFPKFTDFKTVKQQEVDCAIKKINTRPRKILNYETPYDLMHEYQAAFAA
ncbi:IS30 family transposase [Marinicellulosiphila megalodicopiae]|uniref:IS30 family transposase n=1 Tax=Marinicellulosiphila megalodicopiae TaxID=2724896 RepID=UPI003BB0FFC0